MTFHYLKFALVLGVLAVAAVGCGDDASDTATRPAATATPQAPPATLQLVAPANGDTLGAAFGDGRGATVVAGTAPVGTRVRVRAACEPEPCLRETTTGADERWRVTLRLRVGPVQRSLSLIAQDADPASTVPDSSVVLAVSPPARRPARDRPATRRPRPARTARPSRPQTPPEIPSAPLPIPTASTPQDGAAPSGAPPGSVRLIGDSLAVGIRDLLPAALGGARVVTDAEIGRSMATGMAIVRRAPRGVPLAISLFTNDDPRQLDALEQAVRTSVRQAGPSSCAVWATIVRPPLNGVPYTAANARLRSLARRSDLGGRLRLVAWDSAIDEHPDWLAADGVHATPAGYRGRAALYARALAGC